MSNKDLRASAPTFTEQQLQERMALYAGFEHMQAAFESAAKAFKLVFPHIPKLALPPGQISKFGAVAQAADNCAKIIMQMQVQCGIARMNPVEPKQGEPAPDAASETKPENPPSDLPKPSLVLP